MKLKKAPAELVELISKTMEGVDCEKRLMFGFPAYFTNTHMFAGLFEDKLFFRLPAAQIDSLKARSGTISNLEPMPGRAMKDYWVMPAKVVSDPERLRSLAVAAAEHTRSLGPKPAKPVKKTPRRSGKKSKDTD
jgi:TfoX/Sxy family transcriptional regulator of competence genes